MKLSNNKYYRFLFLYFFLFGVCTFMFLIISLFLDGFDFENKVRTLSIMAIVPTLLNVLWFGKSQQDIVELWIKRAYFCVISMGWIALWNSVFANGFSIYIFALSFGLGLVVMLILGVPFWVILDRREKKKLAEINERLASKNGTDFH